MRKPPEDGSGADRVRNILVAEPDASWMTTVTRVMRQDGWVCFPAASPEQATQKLHERTYDAFLFSSELGTSTVDGLMRDVRARYFRARVVLMLPAHAVTRGESWRFMRDLVLLQRPCSPNRIIAAVNKAVAPTRLKRA